MRPTFHPSLVNDPFHDPCLFINFLFESRAIAFDLGDIHALSPRDVLKITHIFISHTHIDHFAGFDRLLRLTLGREKTVHLFGPDHFLAHVEGKLSGYTWNLADNYEHSLTLRVTEIQATKCLTRTYPCRNRFRPVGDTEETPPAQYLINEPRLTVSAVRLDHGIPCLGFRLDERFHININKDALYAMGLAPGSWLRDFKNMIYDNRDGQTVLAVPQNGQNRTFLLGELKDRIAIITPGQTITYITDVVYSPANVNTITRFARESDRMFVEAHFTGADEAIARQKSHLTAPQAGEIAALSQAGRFTPFHYSPRYIDRPDAIEKEAMDAFQCRFTAR
ncbi:MAG: MBL fold metallo-hydrolase [Thermodesulfobacteriota bacterium]|nr:MBL fold metallo-hydrolase [Thermodesulfobacteriota bacterium]